MWPVPPWADRFDKGWHGHPLPFIYPVTWVWDLGHRWHLPVARLTNAAIVAIAYRINGAICPNLSTQGGLLGHLWQKCAKVATCYLFWTWRITRLCLTFPSVTKQDIHKWLLLLSLCIIWLYSMVQRSFRDWTLYLQVLVEVNPAASSFGANAAHKLYFGISCAATTVFRYGMMCCRLGHRCKSIMDFHAWHRSPKIQSRDFSG